MPQTKLSLNAERAIDRAILKAKSTRSNDRRTYANQKKKDKKKNEEDKANAVVPGDQVIPEMFQIAYENYGLRTFKFTYPPTNIEYSNMAPEWVEVQRQGQVPIIGLSSYKLMRFQFEFLIAKPFDGIWAPVEDELKLLKEIVTSPTPVFLNNFDTIVNTPFVLPGSSRKIGDKNFFRITDFSISSLRRNTKMEITAAQCTIAFQEDYVVGTKAIEMPKIEYPPIMKPRTKKTATNSSGPYRCTVPQYQVCDSNGNLLPFNIGLV